MAMAEGAMTDVGHKLSGEYMMIMGEMVVSFLLPLDPTSDFNQGGCRRFHDQAGPEDLLVKEGRKKKEKTARR